MVLSPTSVAKKLILPIFKIFKKREDFFSVKTAQCSCSLVTWLWKIWSQSLLRRLGLMEKPQPSKQAFWKPNFSKSINSEQFLQWIPQHCAQSWSDNIYIYPLIARLQVSRVWREKELVCRVLKKLKVCWVFDFTGGFGLKVLSCWFWLRTGVLYSEFLINSWKQIEQ